MRTAAVVGCGKYVEGKEGWAIGHHHARGYLTADPEIHLYGVDPNLENLAAFGKAFQIPDERLFGSMDDLFRALIPGYLSVCTWPGLHAAMVGHAARAGVKGILCEKPMAMDVAEIREMQAACTAAGARLGIAHQRRHLPVFQNARRLLCEGLLGHEYVLEARVGDGWDILSWTTHWFDIANFLFDAQPVSVLAGLQCTGQRRYGHAVEDASVVFLDYSAKRQALFVTGPETPGQAWISLRGPEGMLAIHGENRLEIFHRTGYREHLFEAPVDGFAELLKNMIAAVETGSPFVCGVENTASATEIAFAAHDSARLMRKIPLPPVTQFPPLEVKQHPAEVRQPNGRVVLFADDHFGSGGRSGLRALLQTLYRSVGVWEVEASEGLKKGDTADAGLLVIYHTQSEADAGTRQTLENWVREGRPTLIVHAGLGAYPSWEDYLRWCGRCWDWQHSRHPHASCWLEATGPAPFPWTRAWLPKDEVFMDLAQKSECRDLLMARTEHGVHPAAWTNVEFPNIAVWVPGHRADTWTVPAVQDFCAVLTGQALAIAAISPG